MKTIAFLAVAADTSRAALGDWLVSDFGPQLARRPGVQRCAVSVVQQQPLQQVAAWDAAIDLWSDDLSVVAAALSDAGLLARTRRVAVYAVNEMVGKDELAQGLPATTLKLLAPWVRRADVSPAEARRHWDEHVPLANRIHTGCARYIRHWVEGVAVSHGEAAPAYQGIAFQYFPTAEDYELRSFDKPEDVPIIQNDIADFLSACDAIVTRETVFGR